MKHRLLAGLALAFIVAVVATPALAQATGTIVNFAWVVDLLVALALPVVGAFGGWLALKVSNLVGLNIEARHREALSAALEKAAAYGLRSAAEMAKRNASIDVRSEAIAEALRYAEKSVPDAISHFGLSGSRLKEMVVARLPDQPGPAK